MTPIEWLLSDDTGISSRTIFATMTNSHVAPHNMPIPFDPADFGRCYRLLKAFPLWRLRLREVADRFPEWGPIVNAWPELEAIYEVELGNADGRAPLLYSRMKEIEPLCWEVRRMLRFGAKQ
jgi:hypothetical protein